MPVSYTGVIFSFLFNTANAFILLVSWHASDFQFFNPNYHNNCLLANHTHIRKIHQVHHRHAKTTSLILHEMLLISSFSMHEDRCCVWILQPKTFTPVAYELRIHEHTRRATDCWDMPKIALLTLHLTLLVSLFSLPDYLLQILIPQPKPSKWLPTSS